MKIRHNTLDGTLYFNHDTWMGWFETKRINLYAGGALQAPCVYPNSRAEWAKRYPLDKPE